MVKNKITLYPSNWLYNAGVTGFLEIIAYAKGDKYVEEKILRQDGTVSIEREIFNETIDFYKKYNKEKKNEKELPLIGKNRRYPNYLQPGEESIFECFSKNIINISEDGTLCGLCSRNFSLDLSDLCDKAQKLAKRLTSNFQVIHNSLLGPSIGEFPNAFWNINSSISICPLCAYLLIHHHIPFELAETKDGQIFINAPSFKVMWYLNKFAEHILSKNKSYQVREILGISFMEFAQKVFITLGAWSMMNIEMVIKKYSQGKKQDKNQKKIEYYSLPFEISRVLLQNEIASLISETKEPLILETVLNGNFDYLLNLSHRVLRYSVTGANAFDDKYLSRLQNRDSYSLRKLSEILPELYVKINSTVNKEVII